MSEKDLLNILGEVNGLESNNKCNDSHIYICIFKNHFQWNFFRFM